MSDQDLRSAIRARLEQGLPTRAFPRAESSLEMQGVLDELRSSARELDAKLAIAGFTLKPIEHEGVEQACESCMYYLVRRKWCDLPELAVPVEPLWSCKLWRM